MPAIFFFLSSHTNPPLGNNINRTFVSRTAATAAAVDPEEDIISFKLLLDYVVSRIPVKIYHRSALLSRAASPEYLYYIAVLPTISSQSEFL